MKTQTNSPIKANDALELIRNLPGSRLQVPRDGYAHKRAIVSALGATHLDKPESALVVDERAELEQYVDVIYELVEDQALLTSEIPVSFGKGGISEEEVIEYDTVFTATSNRDILFTEVPLVDEGPIDSAAALLELIREEGRLVYHTTFQRGMRPFRCSLPRYCGEPDAQTEALLDFEKELLESGAVTVEVIPYMGRHIESKGGIIPNIPSAVHILRAV